MVRGCIEVLKALALLALAIVLVELAVLLYSATLIAKETQLLVVETRRVVSETDKRLDGTFRNTNAILIQAGLVASRIEDLSRNMQKTAAVQGQYWTTVQQKTLDSLDRMNTVAERLTLLIDNTNASLNSDLLPNLGLAAHQAELTIKDVGTSVKESSGKVNQNLDDLHLVMADPNWQASLAEIQSAAKHMDEVAAQMEEAAKSAPHIAASVDKIATTSAKWRRWTIAATIVSAVVRAFF